MKVSKLFLTAVIALSLGFTACSNDDDVSSSAGGEKGNTHVSVTLKLSQNSGLKSTKADPAEDYNGIGKWAGKDKIKSITVYLVDGTSVYEKNFAVGTGEAYEASNTGGTVTIVPKTEAAAIKTTTGNKKVYVLINAAAEVTAHLKKTPVAEFEEAYQKVALALTNEGNASTSKTSASKLAKVDTGDDVTGEDVIVMTNVAPATLDVKANITAAQTIGASTGDAAKNRVSLEVERAVARVMVTIASDGPFTVPGSAATTGQSPLGTISNVTWVLAQGENSLFVQKKSAWETPNYGWRPSLGNYLDAESKYDYSGLFEEYKAAPTAPYGGTKVPTMAAYSADPATVGDKSILNGKFILPTTHLIGEKTASHYEKGNTPYVLVRAHFAPSKAAYADGGEYTTGADFYVGANGKFYTTAANAQNTNTGGVSGQTVAKYVGGKVLYYAWVNPDNANSREWYNSPVHRNNIYHVHINSFRNLGTNWNPLFPEDPANPKTPENGGNPDPKPNVPGIQEPTNPIDPKDPLTTPETWMSVDVKVLPWILHSYQVDLGI